MSLRDRLIIDDDIDVYIPGKYCDHIDWIEFEKYFKLTAVHVTDKYKLIEPVVKLVRKHIPPLSTFTDKHGEILKTYKVNNIEKELLFKFVPYLRYVSDEDLNNSALSAMMALRILVDNDITFITAYAYDDHKDEATFSCEYTSALGFKSKMYFNLSVATVQLIPEYGVAK